MNFWISFSRRLRYASSICDFKEQYRRREWTQHNHWQTGLLDIARRLKVEISFIKGRERCVVSPRNRRWRYTINQIYQNCHAMRLRFNVAHDHMTFFFSERIANPNPDDGPAITDLLSSGHHSHLVPTTITLTLRTGLRRGRKLTSTKSQGILLPSR